MDSVRYKYGTIWFGLFLAINVITSGCKPKPVTDKIQFVQSLSNNFEDPGTWLGKAGDAAEGRRFTRVDTGQGFSAGFIFPVPDSLVNCDLRIVVSCYIRKGERDGAHALVVSLQNNDTTAFWETFEADNYSFKNDVWVYIKDSTQIPAFANSARGLELRFFGWSPRMESYFDLDDLKATISKVEILKK